MIVQVNEKKSRGTKKKKSRSQELYNVKIILFILSIHFLSFQIDLDKTSEITNPSLSFTPNYRKFYLLRESRDNSQEEIFELIFLLTGLI